MHDKQGRISLACTSAWSSAKRSTNLSDAEEEQRRTTLETALPPEAATSLPMRPRAFMMCNGSRHALSPMDPPIHTAPKQKKDTNSPRGAVQKVVQVPPSAQVREHCYFVRNSQARAHRQLYKLFGPGSRKSSQARYILYGFRYDNRPASTHMNYVCAFTS